MKTIKLFVLNSFFLVVLIPLLGIINLPASIMVKISSMKNGQTNNYNCGCTDTRCGGTGNP